MTRSRRLWVVLGLNLALVAGLAAAGLSSHSLGVLAAAVDYLADATAIGVALVALRLSSRPTGTSRRRRASAVAAAVNGGWLLVLSALVIAGAAHRLVAGAPEVHPLPVIVMSGVAALVMVAGAIVLQVDADDDDQDDEDDDARLSVRVVLLDTAADSASAAGSR